LTPFTRADEPNKRPRIADQRSGSHGGYFAFQVHPLLAIHWQFSWFLLCKLQYSEDGGYGFDPRRVHHYNHGR
jgi:hypothetical protein